MLTEIERKIRARAYSRAWRNRNPEKVKALAKRRVYTTEQRQRATLRMRKWRKDNPERVLQLKHEWRKKHPKAYREAKRLYDARRAGFNDTIPQQTPNCQICGVETYTVLDHDHFTGKFRGWLCRRCNTAIALLKDDPILCEKANEYLKGDVE